VYNHRIYQLLRFCLVILSVIVMFLVIQFIFPYIYPFLLAIMLSLFLNPVVTFLENAIKMPRGFAVFTVLLLTVTALLGCMILLISELMQGTTYMAKHVPDYFRTFVSVLEKMINEQLLPLYHKLASYVHTLSPDQQANINESIHDAINQFASFSTGILQNLLLQIPAALSLLPGSITIFLFIIMAAFFITKDWHRLINHTKKMIPQNVLHSIGNVWKHMQKALSGLLKAQLRLISITALTIFAGLLLMRVEYALTIALIAALADILPFIGTGIIFVPWIIYTFLTADYALTIALSVLYMIVVIQRQLLEPKIVSDNAGLNPLAVLIALFIGIQIWGAFGLFLAPLVVIIGHAFFRAGVFHQVGRFIKGS